MKPTTIDFETEGIEKRPHYPPRPVGVSIKRWGKRPRYYAWGHPTKNNCTKLQAKAALLEAYKNPDGIIHQNGKFDIDVAETHLGLPRLSWDKYHDTLYLLFLDDPHADSLSLKPSAERLLHQPPDEQDAVRDWLIKHQPAPGVKISATNFGKYICLAPGDLVGKYANGDTSRTEDLFRFLWKKTQDRQMVESYDRDRELMPILLETERQGVRVNHKKLKADIKKYEKVIVQLETWAAKQLKVADLTLKNGKCLIDSGVKLVAALIKADKIDLAKLGVTKTGKHKSDKVSLKAAITDKKLAAVLKYRTQLGTCLKTFMRPWCQTAERSGGLIYTTWHQTRSTESGGGVGTRTGRMSSTPNFQNIPNEFAHIFRHEDTKRKELPLFPLKFKLPPLPKCRGYIIPWDKDHVLIDRDYSQQELRILGHFEDGVLQAEYLKDPWMDVHERAQVMINGMLGTNFKRKTIKNISFGLIYGMGVGLMAQMSGITVEEAKDAKDAYLAIFPGLSDMYRNMRTRAAQQLPIRTWGGREYYCEPPKLIDGRMRTFDYKLPNVLIQGSAADCTKQAVINFYNRKKKSWLIYLTVHDEILLSVPKKDMHKAMQVLKESMEDVAFDVPMLSEGDYSAKNWVSLKPYDVKGEVKV